ncbi:amino-terminal region of chorein [Tasmannia lanceolata]|uniref:amino-terminal region of chorein n=1 Tax=Tasmannia lanceolata TaxID=3420 RepID=UPI0040648C26
MESIIAMALEYTLKYWLKSFSRDQFKLQGRTAQLSNLDINGDALHASVGLPPALNVATAKVGKLEIKLPYVSNIQTEPVVVQIDRLDLVLKENSDPETGSSSSAQSSTSSGKGSGYGFADKIADGMTLEVGTVNLLLETRGGARRQGGATWSSPLASITIRNLVLYTTNERWRVVSLKEARDFSINKKFIYLFKKLEWDSLSIDLLPHPDMFTDAHLTLSENGKGKRDDDGAKRLFFGGECFLEGISGQAYITVQRTEQNSPLGLEVQLHVTEVVCPALSEPGLRALLRFMTGLYVCLNRGDVDPKAQQRSTEAAGRSLVSIIVDHIFLCIKDADFQLELLMQSLSFSRTSVSDGENTKNLSQIMVGGLFLRDTFSHPPCTLVQPSMQAATKEFLHIPEFGKNFCPPIYPLGNQRWQLNDAVPLICLHSLQIKPSPAPPSFASQTVIDCQPLMISLQEESCLRISSFLADGIVVNPGDVLPDFSINSLIFTLKEFDLTVPLDIRKSYNYAGNRNGNFQSSFAGARLHVEDLFISESPTIKFRLLNLDKDPACFCLWEDQPIDASQKKWTTRASLLSLSLETHKSSTDLSSSLWKCVELHETCFEATMATADGSPLQTVPPPGGIVRIGVACEQYLSNTSVEQLFFVLDLYAYFGRVSEEIAKVRKSHQPKNIGESLGERLLEKVPSDTAVSLSVNGLQLKFLESSSLNIQGMPLVQFGGKGLFVNVSHRTLGGAIAISSSLCWEDVWVDCVDAQGTSTDENFTEMGLMAGNGFPQMRAVFWIDNRSKNKANGVALTVPFLEISTVHVMPYHAQDMECHSLTVSAKVAGVRLGGGMNYTEALLHRFGILGPDGGPGEGLSKGLKNLSAGPLSKLLRTSPLIEVNHEENRSTEDGDDGGLLELGRPDEVDVSIELKDWLFALEGAQEMEERWLSYNGDGLSREERCWHTTFQSLQVKAKNSSKNTVNSTGKSHRTQTYPVELLTVSVEGLQALKPHARNDILPSSVSSNGALGNCGGVNLEVRMVICEDNEEFEMAKWVVENLRFSVKQPIEAVATKEELEYLAVLCRSEVESMGRIAAGILRVLKLEKSLGRATIDQLSNLGSDSLDRIFTPEKLSRRSSAGSIGFTPTSNMNSESPKQSLGSIVSSLEASLSDSQAKCSALVSGFSNPEFSVHLADVKRLCQNIESMQILLTRLRTQI